MYYRKNILRSLFLIIGFFIAIGTLFYTGSLFERIAKEETEKVQLFAEALKSMSNQEQDGLSIYWSVLQMNKNVPILIFDDNERLLQHKNIEFSPADRKLSQTQLLSKKNMISDPIEIQIGKDTKQYIYYGHSDTLRKLRYIPAIQIILIFMLIILGLIIVKHIQKANQDNLWAGLSKETAHQLGTPISSLIGWIEVLEEQNIAPNYLPEMRKDIDSLNVVSNRFSNIGSTPITCVQNIIPLVEKTIDYMEDRISHSVKIHLNKSSEIINVKVNKELFTWVIENLIKNGVDSIVQRGKITININESDKKVYIDIIDTGKGMSSTIERQIFNPGFTTKKRGWGLGLSLTKRIVKHYHNGRIFVKNTEIGKGTTFRIVLPKA
ncbi:histidine kinase/DNA gyrase B/HSP90-like ATPase [Balneicella halophila]|uniref:histidine kinase n=1 Tax=Balneicella halophila TaxID=1537566 RepID=A0A7L4UP77_BALHA|nr:ATP-binding protein [Balneicella halophila]PVX50970.1 histidine kinase/DNA gyrase B/HSP90-like ATPase [Balneicella halophila]